MTEVEVLRPALWAAARDLHRCLSHDGHFVRCPERRCVEAIALADPELLPPERVREAIGL